MTVSDAEIIEGRKEIMGYLGWSSWKKVLRLAEKCGLPVRKVGGRWVASKVALDAWYEAVLE